MAIQAMHTATTGLTALDTEMSIIANNLANVNTTGFKSSRANFEDLLYQQKQQAGVTNGQGTTKPAGLFIGLGTRISNTQVLFGAGNLINTGRSLDVAIDGDGFFKVSIYDDVGQGIGYTRAGNFFLNRDGELVLGNSNGFRVEPSVQVPTDATSVNISADGIVTAILPGDITPQEVGNVDLCRFVNPEGLEQIGGNLFIQTEASGEPEQASPGASGMGVLVSGFLEGSNVNAVKELVSMINTQRAFELNSKVITASDEMLQTVTRLRN